MLEKGKDRFLTLVLFAHLDLDYLSSAFIHLKRLVHHMVHSVDVTKQWSNWEKKKFSNGAVRHPFHGPGADVL